MLAELMAANAAFSVIKTTLANGRELADAGQALIAYFKNKDALQKKHEKKKASTFSSGDAMEEFLALEQLRRQEDEMREYMIYNGRGGLWSDWLEFSADYRRKQREAAEAERRAAYKRKQQWIYAFKVGLLSMLLCVVFAVLTYLAIYILKTGGH